MKSTDTKKLLSIQQLQDQFRKETGLDIPADQDPTMTYRKSRDFGEFYKSFLEAKNEMKKFITYDQHENNTLGHQYCILTILCLSYMLKSRS